MSRCDPSIHPGCSRSPADGRHRGRGGAVQGLVLRGVFHVSFPTAFPGLSCGKTLSRWGGRRDPCWGHILVSPRRLFPGAVLSRPFLDTLQRRRCPGLPARVSQEQEEKGLHHGEVVSAVCPGIPGIGGPQTQGVGAELDPTCGGGGPWRLGVPSPPVTPLLSPCSGQKYLTAVVKLFGPLTRNYYIRAILHAA